MAKPHRLRDFDYRTPGAYFVTICAYRREMLFEGKEIQEVLVRCWKSIREHSPEIAVDSFVIMPNHVHGIVVIGAPQSVVQFREIELQTVRRGLVAGSLSSVVRRFKAAVTLELRNAGLVEQDQRVWQPNYYDRVIRNEAELDRIRLYIANNPATWAYDHENPEAEIDAAYVADWGWLETAYTGVDG
jgi:REP element-mobilizing transposase RayT